VIRGSTIGRVAAEAAGLAILSAALALGAQAVLPRRIPWQQEWSRAVVAEAARKGIAVLDLAQVKALLAAHTHFVLDARPMVDYDKGRLPGAMPLPFLELAQRANSILPALTPEQPVLTYCSGYSCDEGLQLALALRQFGFTNVVLYAGGFEEWKKAGEATEP
jgi:rhodanese-related sulfurtransferase